MSERAIQFRRQLRGRHFFKNLIKRIAKNSGVYYNRMIKPYTSPKKWSASLDFLNAIYNNDSQENT